MSERHADSSASASPLLNNNAERNLSSISPSMVARHDGLSNAIFQKECFTLNFTAEAEKDLKQFKHGGSTCRSSCEIERQLTTHDQASPPTIILGAPFSVSGRDMAKDQPETLVENLSTSQSAVCHDRYRTQTASITTWPTKFTSPLAIFAPRPQQQAMRYKDAIYESKAPSSMANNNSKLQPHSHYQARQIPIRTTAQDSDVDDVMKSLSSASQCLLMETNDIQKCKVCGDKASGKHYGVLSCDGCRGFFKRSIRKNMDYVCKEDNRCTVDVARRNQCQACRFRKCIENKMNRDGNQHLNRCKQCSGHCCGHSLRKGCATI